MIRGLDIRTIPEALRLAPDMRVTYITGNRPVAPYHGTDIMASLRMQVLVDGMSVYHGRKAEMEWTKISIAIEDIGRIKVIGGPTAASDGTHVAAGIINIITRHFEETGNPTSEFIKAVMVSKASISATAGHLESTVTDLYQYNAVLQNGTDRGFRVSATESEQLLVKNNFDRNNHFLTIDYSL